MRRKQLVASLLGLMALEYLINGQPDTRGNPVPLNLHAESYPNRDPLRRREAQFTHKHALFGEGVSKLKETRTDASPMHRVDKSHRE